MKKPIDKPRKRKDTPAVSKEEFISVYRAEALVRYGLAAEDCSELYVTELVQDVISGQQPPSSLMQLIARAHGARPGRVGNFLRSLR